MTPIFDSQTYIEDKKDHQKNEKEWKNYENNLDNLQLVFHHEQKNNWEIENAVKHHKRQNSKGENEAPQKTEEII